jgi:hypothetical protein
MSFQHRNLEAFMNSTGYVINDRWYPRVTSIISIKAKPGLLKFYGEAASFSDALSTTTRSATEGTAIHNAVEAILKGEEPEIDDTVRPAIDAFNDFRNVHRLDMTGGIVEKRVWSPKYRFAGTIDILGNLDGSFGVVDLKTSSGIWRDYNLQTSAYMGALQEPETWEDLPQRPVEKRWILRIDQTQLCTRCGAIKRTKGGRETIKPPFKGQDIGSCPHEWTETRGEWELKELEGFPSDYEAFLAAKCLWEWENELWIKQVGL